MRTLTTLSSRIVICQAVHSHGNSLISGLLRMVALSRRGSRERVCKSIWSHSVAHDSSSGACAPPNRTAAKAHLRFGRTLAGGSGLAVRDPRRRIMNRTHRPGAPPGAPCVHAPRWRRPSRDHRRIAAAVLATGALRWSRSARVSRLPSRPWRDAEPTPQYTRPADWSPYRPAVHLTPAERWMNDPQRPFWLDGAWHYYYLYNADYPDGNGTEWYHATSTDLVHWREEGVAIEKYRTAWATSRRAAPSSTPRTRPGSARAPSSRS